LKVESAFLVYKLNWESFISGNSFFSFMDIVDDLKLYTTTSLHRSRIETGIPSEEAPDHVNFGGRRIPFNEDLVNIYLVGILLDHGNPALNDPRFCPHSTDLAERLEASPTDTRNKYETHKVTADSLLILATVFDPERLRDESIGAASGNYHCASIHLRELRRGYTPLVLTLKRISNRMESYATILSHLGKHYFNIHVTVSDYYLEQSWKKEILKDNVQQLFELHAQKDPTLQSKINTLIKNIRAIDPDFDLSYFEDN